MIPTLFALTDRHYPLVVYFLIKAGELAPAF